MSDKMFKTTVPMFIMFDKNIQPKKTTGTHYALSMDIDSMVLYTSVLQFYVKGIYEGVTLNNVVFDSLWNKIYNKFTNMDNEDILIYKKILSSITSIYEFMQSNFSSGISFIHQTLDPEFIINSKPESRDKHAIFKYLWDHTDKILFEIPITDSIMMMMLLFTKILIIQCIDDSNARKTITANWTGSYIINYVCNNDRKFHRMCERIFNDPAALPLKRAIKSTLKRSKIPVATTSADAESLCKWIRFRYFGKLSKTNADIRSAVFDKISEYLSSGKYTVDDRHRIIFEMWLVVNSVFDPISDTDVYTELELIKIQAVTTENNAISVLRKIRNTLRSNDMIAVTDDNISSFMDVELFNMTLKIATDMCTSIGQNNKNKKYIQV